MDHFDLTVGENIYLSGVREVKYPRDLVRRSHFRIKDQRNAKLVLKELDLGIVYGIPYSRDSLALGHLLTDNTAQKVHLVGIHDRHHKVGILYSGRAKSRRAGSVSRYGHYIKV